jgi:hypothetical protein
MLIDFPELFRLVDRRGGWLRYGREIFPFFLQGSREEYQRNVYAN